MKHKNPSFILDLLPPQQRRCVELVAKGLTDEEIARVMGLSTYTVHNHLRAVSLRVGLFRTRANLLLYFYTLSPKRLE